jgi:hypothetical protein
MSRNLLYFYGDRGFESVSLQQRVHVLREFAFPRRKAGLFRGCARRGRQKRHPTDTPTAFDLCHCSRCREASGSAFLAELEFKAAEFEWVCGQSLVRTYEAPVRKTPPGYRRTFCTVCGAPVPTVDRGIIRVPAGTLDGDPGIRPQRHLFVDFKAPWFEITDSLGQFGTKPKPS